MTLPRCSLSIMVARTDIPFMMETIPHLVRTSHYPFVERVLFLDTAPLTGDKVGRPGIGTLEQLRENCARLVDMGVIDRLVDMDYDDAYRQRVYKKHFGSVPKPTHNWKGYPILGTIFSLEETVGDYVVHFDSDMLQYQKNDHSWITEGMELMAKRPDVLFVRPLSGPPRADGSLHQRVPYEQDDGFYRFKFFGSRAYLVKKQSFDAFLPIPVLWMDYKNEWLKQLPPRLLTWLNYWTGRGKLDSWEVMISRELERTNGWRATLANPDAWTLHPVARDKAYIAALPKIIRDIEQGHYPAGQEGYYDLNLDLWLQKVGTTPAD
ncbi:MAG: hypothetical protein AAGF93_02800 [Cyanobacteria bacterium P01_H01_bin.105]